MASPGELVRKVAEVLGVPEPTVVVHDRNLVTAGLRTKGGRGRSAAKMTPGDAANLILAVAGSSMVKDTVETVNDYANLPSRVDRPINPRTEPGGPSIRQTESWDLSRFPIPSLQRLPADHTFRDALTALIEAAADGSLQEAVRNLPVEQVGEHRIPNYWRIEVILWGPYPQASVRIYCKDFKEDHHYSAIPTGTDEIMKWADDFKSKNDGGDLKQIREFTAKTILTIGELLKS